jgi:formate-dependent nitrite reductase membrane component NrfD
MKKVWAFLKGCFVLLRKGSKIYYAWVTFLLALMVIGTMAYISQLYSGLIVTAMRDQVSWGFYISNFTFLVGVAAAAVLLVIPAYVYKWKPIKEIAILGELLAVSAMVMCLLFVTVDLGRPDRFWHLIPKIGILNFPQSLLAWDVVVLNTYLVLNFVIAGYMLYSLYYRRQPNMTYVLPLLLFSIPAAISIHTVTAFLYNGLAARPFWNASILAPRFLASAFCSGPAFMILLFQLIRKWTNFEIKDEAIFKVAELIAYAMFINLFLLGAEIFKSTIPIHSHLAPMKYLCQDWAAIRTWSRSSGPRRSSTSRPSSSSSFPKRGELRNAQHRVHSHLHRRLHREGDGACGPRVRSGRTRGILRILPDRDRVAGYDGDLGDRAVRLHDAPADRHSDHEQGILRGRGRGAPLHRRPAVPLPQSRG